MNIKMYEKSNMLKYAILFIVLCLSAKIFAQDPRQEILFDDGWKFKLGNFDGAEEPTYDDASWRYVGLPHDWSIENLPNQKPGEVVGPFSKESIGTTATGYTVGGTGWYRKTFTTKEYPQTIIEFDGVYMNSDVWINGHFLGTYPYGYSAFNYDISDYLNSSGEENVIAVRVKNKGQNSRWYSGSGIYRHVWLIQKQNVHIAHQGVTITTESISYNNAEIKISSIVQNDTGSEQNVKLLVSLFNLDGSVAAKAESEMTKMMADDKEISQIINVPEPQLWSVESPKLYKAAIEVIVDGVIEDRAEQSFGIRTINFNAKTGFTLNGKPVLLKGGCLHHDNGFLGSATIDRAEERRVELMKAYGFNAIRTSHNPPSRQFLDACDRNGILVIDEAFDQWIRPKNPEDYHLYFNDWWKKDLAAMINRDRNHPCVIMWSIGNELNERADSLGFAIRKKLVNEVHRLDSSRPVTEAICGFWDHPGQQWSTTAPAFADLDVGGYNYLWTSYESDHTLYPERIMYGSESFAAEAYDNWQLVKNNSWVVGDFVWTAMDYLGETGVGNSHFDDNPMRVGLQPWPWFNGFCGDIDLCGFKKPQMLYKDVVWGNSKIEMLVHEPIPDGKKEVFSYWGWPNELESWNWEGFEGKIMDVRIFTTYQAIRLELNGEIVDQQFLVDTAKSIINFKVPYQPGVLKAVALENGIQVDSKILSTTGKPAKIKLSADREKIRANRNDLSYVKIELVDAYGNLIPNADVPVKLSVTGVGEIAGSGNASPTDMESFNNYVCKTYRGEALAIIRPSIDKKAGTVTLKAEAKGLGMGEINIEIEK